MVASVGTAVGTAVVIGVITSFVALWLAIVVGVWKVFIKAGRPGWESLIPFWSFVVLCKIVGRPWWWILSFLIPFVGLVVACIVALDVAKSFGQRIGFGLALFLFPWVMYPVLGFGRAQYLGPRHVGTGTIGHSSSQGPSDLLSSI